MCTVSKTSKLPVVLSFITGFGCVICALKRQTLLLLVAATPCCKKNYYCEKPARSAEQKCVRVFVLRHVKIFGIYLTVFHLSQPMMKLLDGSLHDYLK